jgi:hypothetical protein
MLGKFLTKIFNSSIGLLMSNKNILVLDVGDAPYPLAVVRIKEDS